MKKREALTCELGETSFTFGKTRENSEIVKRKKN